MTFLLEMMVGGVVVSFDFKVSNDLEMLQCEPTPWQKVIANFANGNFNVEFILNQNYFSFQGCLWTRKPNSDRNFSCPNPVPEMRFSTFVGK